MESQPPYDDLDPGIKDAVRLLFEGGVETFESCQGGEGHSYLEPAIRFAGERQDGFKALAIALGARLKVSSLRRIWLIQDDEPTGPYWEIAFVAQKAPMVTTSLVGSVLSSDHIEVCCPFPDER